MNVKLKPCPFCGGKAVLKPLPYKGEVDNNFYKVECSSLGCIEQSSYRYKEFAIRDWNTRTGNFKRLLQIIKRWADNECCDKTNS